MWWGIGIGAFLYMILLLIFGLGLAYKGRWAAVPDRVHLPDRLDRRLRGLRAEAGDRVRPDGRAEPRREPC